MRRRLLNVAVVGSGVMLFGVLWLWGISYRGTYQYEWWSPSYVQWICIYRGQLAWSQYRRPPSQYAWVQSRGEWYRVPPRDLSEPPGWRGIGQGRLIQGLGFILFRWVYSSEESERIGMLQIGYGKSVD